MSFEITKICRTCLGLDGILLSIYDNKGSNGSGRIADMLRDIVNVEAKKSDGMPEKVCLMCISEINRCYSFKMKCDNSDRTLRQLLNIPKDPLPLVLPKLNTGKGAKSTTESNSLLYDIENKELMKPLLLEGNQDSIKENCSSVIASNIIISDQTEEKISYFGIQSEDDEVIEQENKKEEILDEQNSGDYSIIFTKLVDETQEETQVIDEEEDAQKSPSSKEIKLESKCSLCPMSFVHYRNLKKHMIKVHNASELTFTDISKDSNIVPFDGENLGFSREEIENGDEEEYDLQLIEEIEDTIVKLEPQPVSRRIETEEKELRCPRCRALFAMHSSLNIHIKLNKCTKPQFSCGDCKKVFISLISLKEHIKTHKLFCEICGESLESKHELSKHREEHQGVNLKHQCPVCRKVFTMRSTLNDHIRIHTGEKPFVCDLCGKAFSQNANLRQHVMRHNKTKPFKCNQCHRSFVSKGELYAHLRSHNGEQPFRCDSCPSAFTTSSSLVKHKRIHTGERPYSCDFCPMRFTALNTLKNHRRTHTGEKPYMCKYCPRAFAQKSDCSIHMRTHTGERRHSCNICNMKFQQSGTLRTHMKTHIEKVPRSQQELEGHKEKQYHELNIIEVEEGKEMLEEQQDRRQVRTSETVADSEESMEINQDGLLHFNIDECASGE